MRRQRLLCPVDLFEHSRLVFKYARAVAAENGAGILLLTVMEPMLQASVLVGESERLEHDLLADLEKLIDEVPPPAATRPECRVSKGVPHTAIIATCRDEHCDLIVMGTHGRRGLGKMFFGSTLERVLRETTVPVLAIPPGASGLLSSVDADRLAIRRVLVGIDFSQSSMEAARVAASMARQHEARLSLLHVITPAANRGGQVALEEQHEARTASARHALTLVADEFCREHIRATSSVVTGEPEEVIAEQAVEEPGTLVVLGLRDTGSPVGARPGAIAYRVLSLCRAPMMVVPASANHLRAKEAEDERPRR